MLAKCKARRCISFQHWTHVNTWLCFQGAGFADHLWQKRRALQRVHCCSSSLLLASLPAPWGLCRELGQTVPREPRPVSSAANELPQREWQTSLGERAAAKAGTTAKTRAFQKLLGKKAPSDNSLLCCHSYLMRHQM